ncbi:hypothetical protein BFF78_36390 [Streptomyces fodineus]|uniref:Uncharacterized protein n=1 Tax=Streptomyces fodineus TaxID=1904616 RepID=A0A1D7YJW7_9ACTN|nr:hypothetical protein [Streptomyces fodineus]AOR35822.1 hypothetical protein BFF78_36390 [Streptomyces fodineus]
MTSRAIQVEQPGVPAGTALVLYACLPASLGAKADNTVDAARRYAKEANCEVVAEGAYPLTSSAIDTLKASGLLTQGAA